MLSDCSQQMNAAHKGRRAAKENTMKTNAIPSAWSRITATVLGAGAIALGVMALSAPLANADALQS